MHTSLFILACLVPTVDPTVQVKAKYPSKDAAKPGKAVVATYPTRQWAHEFKQGPFRFHSEFVIKTAPLLRDLAQIQDELKNTLGLAVGDRSIAVYFYQDWSSYRQATKAYIPKGLVRRALFVKGDKQSYVFAYRHRGFDTDVRHECTHALVHNAVEFIPLWMDEGLAEYFEKKAGNERIRPSSLGEVRRAMFWRQSFSLEDLERLSSISEMGYTQYRNSWAWIHFLMNDTANESTARKILFNYLAEIRKGKPPGNFSEYLRKSMTNDHARMAQHFRAFR